VSLGALEDRRVLRKCSTNLQLPSTHDQIVGMNAVSIVIAFAMDCAKILIFPQLTISLIKGHLSLKNFVGECFHRPSPLPYFKPSL
jgi:hypothetical protein